MRPGSIRRKSCSRVLKSGICSVEIGPVANTGLIIDMTVHPSTIAYGLIPFNGRGLAVISGIGLRRNYLDHVKLLWKGSVT